MATRVSGRFAPPPPTQVDLPTLPRPQVVDADGFELSDAALVALAGEVSRAGTAAAEEAMEVEEEAGEEEDVEEEAVDEGEEGGDEAEEEAEEAETAEMEMEIDEPEEVPGRTPLLSLADR